MDQLLQVAVLGEIEDDLIEAAILQNNMHQPRNNIFVRSTKYSRFNINALSEEECLSLFRFHKDDITRLVAAFGLPQEIRCGNRYQVTGISYIFT